MPNFSFLSGSNILVRGGWLYSDYNASLSSNWTELDWTGTELGNIFPVFSFEGFTGALVGKYDKKHWLYNDYNASLSSNWTELDWTGTELGKIMFIHSQ